MLVTEVAHSHSCVSLWFGWTQANASPSTCRSFRGERGDLSLEGVVSRSVRDTAAVLDCVSGSDLGAPYHCLPKWVPI